ncbi:5f219bd1-df1e-450b-ab3b-ff7bf2769211 [Thermothielavioides terrestris]|uniref:5f219bd1-df1e-450b-ab3b-ff7bf2769211 n=1 Tax=Thermothielavioides terrestris TaxID=2587410 RepID=A0A3S4AWQ1_9PEZI|nr:5f219bd1-df1e-450b-ab3b-ff7bf2769211 [Thermothielavioides terrestris]
MAPPRVLERSTSPEDGPRAILAAAETVTGLVLDDDADVEAFVAEDSPSPVPEEDRVGSPKLPSATAGKTKSPTQQSGSRSGRHGGKGSAAAKAAHLPGQPIVPRKVEDWEPWKDILHQLYITQNRILRDIIGIMETKYNVRATPKMYKNQFARWGFFKYAVKRRSRAQAESPTGNHSDDSLDSIDSLDSFDSLDGTLVLTRDALMHESEGAYGRQLGFTAVRRFLHGHIDRNAAHLTTEEVAGFVDPCYRYFKVAMDLFDLEEYVEGGRVLRLAFLQIERKISNPTMKSFSDLCFLVPHLLLESGRKEILAAYLRYLARLAIVKFGKHPVAELAASFAKLADERPEDMMRYIMVLSQIHADTIAALPGMLDRNRQWARNQYLACQRTVATAAFSSSSSSSTSSSSSSSSRKLAAVGRPHDHHMIRLEAQSVYWAQALIMQDPEVDAMAQQWLRRQFDADFSAKCEAHLAALQARVAEGSFPAVFARLMECLFVGWLYDYYETVEDWDRAFRWGRLGLDLCTDEQYAIWSIHLEKLMARHGRPGEAAELRRRRQQHAWMEKVRLEVDRLTLG